MVQLNIKMNKSQSQILQVVFNPNNPIQKIESRFDNTALRPIYPNQQAKAHTI